MSSFSSGDRTTPSGSSPFRTRSICSNSTPAQERHAAVGVDQHLARAVRDGPLA